jgi:hypothetical protein
VHSADNIRDDYLIGKVLGSGKIYILQTLRISFYHINYSIVLI